jgi:hypothetical protein
MCVKTVKWSILRERHTALYIDTHGNEWKMTQGKRTLKCNMEGCCARGHLNQNGFDALQNGRRAGLRVVTDHNHEFKNFDARRVLLNEVEGELSEAGKQLEALEGENLKVVAQAVYFSDLHISGKQNLDIVKVFRFRCSRSKKG